jgi:hypothetical protein
VDEKSAAADAATASRTEVVVEPKDVMICFSSSDKEFAGFLQSSLERSGVSVWCEHSADRAPPGIAGKAVMATKVRVSAAEQLKLDTRNYSQMLYS